MDIMSQQQYYTSERHRTKDAVNIKLNIINIKVKIKSMPVKGPACKI